MSDEPRRGAWQFSIRDTCLLMVIAGLMAGWYVDRNRLADELWRQQVRYNIDTAVRDALARYDSPVAPVVRMPPPDLFPIEGTYFSELQALTGTTPSVPDAVQADGTIINCPAESPMP